MAIAFRGVCISLVVGSLLASAGWGQTSVPASAPTSLPAAEAPLAPGLSSFDVPRMEKIAIDGQAEDWEQAGLRVEIMTGEDGQIARPADFDPTFRLSWNDQGLLVLVKVRDDVAKESDSVARMLKKDAVQIVLATRPGSPQWYQMVVSPGIDPSQPRLRARLDDFRKDRDGVTRASMAKLTADMKVSRTADGYIVEALLPWKNLGLSPKLGDELAAQVCVFDADGETDLLQACWYPHGVDPADPGDLHRIRLADKPAPAIRSAVTGTLAPDAGVEIHLAAVAELAGKTVTIVSDAGRPLAKAVLVGKDGRSSAELRIPAPANGERRGKLAVRLGEQTVASVLTTGCFPRTLQTAKGTMQYLLYLPDGYTPADAKRWPMILFLHGAGQRGLNVYDVLRTGLPHQAQRTEGFPFILVSPQCPPDTNWGSDVEITLLLSLLKDVAGRYNVDADRVYLTGLSMGGFGTWRLAALHPELFAAAAPICGGGNPADAPKLKDLPMWVFHGQMDRTVPYEQSESMVQALKAVGSGVKFTTYPEADHMSWAETYSNPEFFQWLLAQHRGEAKGK